MCLLMTLGYIRSTHAGNTRETPALYTFRAPQCKRPGIPGLECVSCGTLAGWPASQLTCMASVTCFTCAGARIMERYATDEQFLRAKDLPEADRFLPVDARGDSLRPHSVSQP